MNDQAFEDHIRSMLHEAAPADVPVSLLLGAEAIPKTARPVTGWQPRRHLRALAGLAAVLVVTVIVGTGLTFRAAVSDRSTPSPPSATPAPSSPAPSPSVNPWLSGARITEAIRFREDFGLRSDLAWVRSVARMPDAMFEFGIPMTPDELATLQRRNASADAIIETVKSYGAEHPDAWAGAYIDSDRNVVAMFTQDLDVHEAALRSRLGPAAPLIVRGVDWTDVQLQAVFRRIQDDGLKRGWFLAHGIYPLGLGVDTIANQVEVEVSSARTDLDAVLEARYDAFGMLEITSDGTGARLMPTGTLAGRVVDATGAPVALAGIELTSDVTGAGTVSDVGMITDSKGRFEIPDVTAVTYDVIVYTFDSSDTKHVLGHAPATVLPGRTTNVTITIRTAEPAASPGDGGTDSPLASSGPITRPR